METFSFDHVHIYSANIETTAEFYTRVLGATEIRRVAAEAAKLIHLNLNGIRLVISECSDSCPQGLQHFAVSVDSIGESKKMLEKFGINIDKEQEVGQFKNIFFKDPNGVSIEIISPSTK